MKNLLMLVCMLVPGCMAIAQIPNAGFEDWTNVPGYDAPTGWGQYNAATSSSGVYTCMKGIPGAPGGSYLKLASRSIPGMGVVAGFAVSGTLDPVTLAPVSGFACTTRPVSLTGNWQYMATGMDRGYISVLTWKWNTATLARDTVSYTYQLLTGMVMEWTPFTIPLAYWSADVPDSAVIVLSSSGNFPAESSSLFVDSLGFSSVPVTTGINGTTVDGHSIDICPNPATSIMHISTATGPATLQVYDAIGRQVYTTMFTHTTSIGTAAWARGLYTVCVTDSSGSMRRKVVVE